MTTYHVLYNPFAGSGWSEEKEKEIINILPNCKLCFHNMTEISYDSFIIEEIERENKLLIVGGDGTLNRFVNDTSDIEIPNEIFYLAGGSGNDFLHDIGGNFKEPVQINGYLERLPEVDVKGKKYKFINGIGFGIDGYCCAVGDAQKERSNKRVRYTSIAVKGLLFHFQPVNAVITVDGVRHRYQNVWLAPTMNGRYYGGGMMPTPNQNRMNEEESLSVLVWHGKGKIKTLMAFPSIFKGEHLRKRDRCEVLSGQIICVEFDRPTPLQIDGETIPDVLKYEAVSHSEARSEKKQTVMATA